MWDFRPFVPASFRAPARKVTRVFLHCTDSDSVTPDYFGPALAATVDSWHKANGWAGIGYSFIIDKAGAIMTARPLEIQPAAQLGPDGLGNVASIAISLHGSKHWTERGLMAVRDLCAAIDKVYSAAGAPATFWPHCDIDPRPCPVYACKALLGLDDSRRFGSAVFVAPALLANDAGGTDWPKLAIVDPPAPPIGARSLFEGCHGEDVTALQTKLGFTGTDADSWFGPKTYAALAAFQSAHALPATGIVDAATRAALNL